MFLMSCKRFGLKLAAQIAGQRSPRFSASGFRLARILDGYLNALPELCAKLHPRSNLELTLTIEAFIPMQVARPIYHAHPRLHIRVERTREESELGRNRMGALDSYRSRMRSV